MNNKRYRAEDSGAVYDSHSNTREWFNSVAEAIEAADARNERYEVYKQMWLTAGSNGAIITHKRT